MTPLEPQDIAISAPARPRCWNRPRIGQRRLRLFHEHLARPARWLRPVAAANHAICSALQDVAAKAQTTLIIPPPALHR